MNLQERRALYWRKNLQLTGSLTLVWFVVTFVIAYFARDLSFNFFGWPFSFWVGAQGALLVYAVIVVFYAWAMRHLDRDFGAVDTE